MAWYGRLEGKATDLQPKYPIDVVEALTSAGAEPLRRQSDQGIPAASVEKMRKALKDAKKPCEIVVYPQAEHGFNADYRPSYNKEAAEAGWKRLLDWFKKNGVA